VLFTRPSARSGLIYPTFPSVRRSTTTTIIIFFFSSFLYYKRNIQLFSDLSPHRKQTQPGHR
jgi:hypothetical protein